MKTIIFYTMLGLCLVSFALFAAQVIDQLSAASRAKTATSAAGVAAERFGGLAEAFGRAIPMAGSAILAVFFAVIAAFAGAQGGPGCG